MSIVIEVVDNQSAAAVEVAVATPGPKGDPSAGAYISAIDTTTQALASVNESQQVAIGTSLEGDDITLVDNAILFGTAGVYSITWSVQFTSSANAVRWAEVWHRLNGEDIANSNSRFDVQAIKSGVLGHTVGTINIVLTVAAGDELSLQWAGEALGISIATLVDGVSGPPRPQIPGVILTAMQVR